MHISTVFARLQRRVVSERRQRTNTKPIKCDFKIHPVSPISLCQLNVVINMVSVNFCKLL